MCIYILLLYATKNVDLLRVTYHIELLPYQNGTFQNYLCHTSYLFVARHLRHVKIFVQKFNN